MTEDEKIADVKDWSKASLTDLAEHIENKHHRFMKEYLPKLQDFIARVTREHVSTHSETLSYLTIIFESFWTEIEEHLLKEENILFPYIRQLEAYSQGKGEKPATPGGTVEKLVKHMEVYEHVNAGQTLVDIREFTMDYSLPDDATETFLMLYDGLQEMEKNLYEHIDLENNILFPRTVELEKKCGIAG